MASAFKKGKKVELIAPAGNPEKMKTALAFGADAVYLGIPDFSLRARINEFNLRSIKEAVFYARQKGKKVYVTLNIFARDKHFKKLPGYISELKKLKVDALIISDPGILRTVRRVWPKALIHLSTQANCINSEAALFWQEEGVRRIILGREASLRDIKEIKKNAPKLELEYFVHGAMCMAYSGRCFLSSYLTARSANLGDCSHPCRWKYYGQKNAKAELAAEALAGAGKSGRKEPQLKMSVTPHDTDEEFIIEEDDGGSFILNSKDLCLIRHLKELISAGVTSFKIEGRTKSVYYVATVVGAYAKVLENLGNAALAEVLQKELEEKTYNRGFHTGFIFDREDAAQDLTTSRRPCDWEFCGQVLKNEKPKTAEGNFLNFIKVHNVIKAGEDVEVVRPYYDVVKFKVRKIIDAKTKEELKEAHGGVGRIIIIESKEDLPEFSILRRFKGNEK